MIYIIRFFFTIKGKLCSGHSSFSLDVQNEFFQKIFILIFYAIQVIKKHIAMKT